jgi:hypothetical protein
VQPGRIDLVEGTVEVPADAHVVHCAASGLKSPRLVPIWDTDAITLQPVRAGFPCFGAAVTGYVEATRTDTAEKNRLCPPSPFPDGLAEWAAMTLLGTRASMSFGAERDITAWAGTVALNPARIPPGHPGSAALDDALARIQEHRGPALERLAELCGERAAAS